MLTVINTILYATDLNSETESVLSMAMSVAEKYQAKVSLLNVIEPINPSVYSWGSVESWTEIANNTLNRSQEISEQQLNDFFDNRVPQETPVSRPSIKVINGRVAQSILRYADEIDADLIVIGSNGHGVMSELLIGSVANKVIHLSKRPVLLVPIPEG
jgi:nucleotide-binding universal stress UspA family protein